MQTESRGFAVYFEVIDIVLEKKGLRVQKRCLQEYVVDDHGRRYLPRFLLEYEGKQRSLRLESLSDVTSKQSTSSRTKSEMSIAVSVN